MNSQKRKYFILYTAICFVSILTTLILDYEYKKVSNAEFDVVQFEKELLRQDVKMRKATLNFASDLVDDPQNLWEIVHSKHKNTSYEWLVFSDKSIVAWSTHLLPIDDSIYFHLDSRILHLTNGWYYTAIADTLNYRIVSLLPIKYEYPYQNQYIQNYFAECFNLSHEGIEISFEEKKGSFCVNDSSGRALVYVNQEFKGQVGNTLALWSLIFLCLALLMFCYLLFCYLKYYFKKELDYKVFALLGMLFTGLYYLFFVLDWYVSTEAFELFSPMHFAYSEWLSSVGSFLALSVFIVFLAFVFHRFYNRAFIFFKGANVLNYFLGLIIVLIVFSLDNLLFFIVIKHSTDVNFFTNVIDIDGITIVKLFNIFFLFVSFVIVFDKLISQYSKTIKSGHLILYSIIGLVAYYVIQLSTNGDFSIVEFLFFVTIVIYLVLTKRGEKNRLIYRDFLWLVLIFDIFIVAQSFLLNINKEKESRLFLIENLANNLEGEQDPVAEMFFASIEKSIETDPNIEDMILNDAMYDDDIRQYFLKNYFLGYLNRYDVQVIPCWPSAELYVNGTENTSNCYSFFDSLLYADGDVVYGSENFHYIHKNNGRVNYFGTFNYFEGDPRLETKLYLELTSKPYFEGLGYPELLLSQKEKNKLNILKGYSYAKYVNGTLVKKSGDYLYKFYNTDFFVDSVGVKEFIDKHDYSHLIYSPNSNEEIIMSFHVVTLSNLLIAFSILYIVFTIITMLLVLLFRSQLFTHYFASSIQERIQALMVLFLIFLLIVIGTSSILYSVNQFKNKNRDMLSQRLKSVMLELDQQIGSEERLTEEMSEYLNYLLQKFSNIFYSDINLYDLNGEILATSRPELYHKGIVGNYMNPEAYRELVIKGERELIQDESIGKLKYISAYVPFVNQNNEVLAYLNLPYFVGVNELQNEISSVLAAIINAYLVFILIAISLAVVASRQVTRPLYLIQERLSQTRLGYKTEKIQYHRKDEIGQLVKEYNRMVDELADSASKLAKSEREGAWREMAKQIAHEIKNPLTPMKLSIQYLQKAWDDKVEDFDRYIKRVTDTLTDQINQLSVIATEFSHFAKMPVASIEPIDVIEKLMNTVSLFERSSDVEFIVENFHKGRVIVLFGSEQILSVFNNLIKNAVQSIPKDRKGKIVIQIRQDEYDVVISFKDNGKGIEPHVKEKMFTPNFTTKSSGMGLGLAIVKNIVEHSNGKIWFETKMDVGSTFFISIPCAKD